VKTAWTSASCIAVTWISCKSAVPAKRTSVKAWIGRPALRWSTTTVYPAMTPVRSRRSMRRVTAEAESDTCSPMSAMVRRALCDSSSMIW